jgi:Txe/YoeB family toxin of toxin-antitoxin system
MELFLNECSISPVAADIPGAKNRIIHLLETAGALRPHGFNVVRAHNNFFAEDLGAGYTASNFLTDGANSLTLRILLQSVVKNPFIPDEDSYEAAIFVLNRFQTLDEKGLIVEPEGLAAAYVHESQSIGFVGCAHWEQETLSVDMINQSEQISTKNILNHTHATCTDNPAFKVWLDLLKSGIALNSLENIHQLFPPAQFEFEPRAAEEFISWYYDDVRFQNKIKLLLEDIAAHPFTGGLGLTETLSGTNGKASKRITGKDRLIYTYTHEKITIHQCRGHYEDH